MPDHYSAVVLSYRRPQNLIEVIASLRMQEPAPSTVLVFHNSPSRMRVVGAVNVCSSHNFGCHARHAAAMLLPEHRIVFIDDDVVLRSSTVASKLLAALERSSVTGAVGRDLADGDHPYTDGREKVGSTGEVDVVKGWLCAARRDALADVLHISAGLPEEIRGEDDICLSAATELCGGPRPVLAGIHPDEVRHLRDQIGQDKRPDHYARRDAACLAMRAIGWTS